MPPTSSNWQEKWLPRALSLLLILLTLWAYRGSFAGAFNYDDGLCIVEATGIDDWWPADGKLTTGKRRWLTHLTLVANYKLHGLRVWGYHAVNLAIHITGGLLLFGLVRRTLQLPESAERYRAAAPWLALACAALWLVHPLQTESVTYIVQRLESLAGLFFLLTLYCLLRGAQSQRAWPWYVLLVLAVTLGTGAKETMYVVPLVALAFDRIFLTSSWHEVWSQRKWVYLSLLPVLCWAGLMLQGCFTPGTRSLMGFGYRGVTPWEYLRSQPAVLLHYLKLCFWPVEQCLDYAWPVEHDPLRIYGGGAIIVLLLLATGVALWRWPRVGFLCLAFFVVLAPTSSFMPIRDLAFEHRMYLPLACVAILVVLGSHALCTFVRIEQAPRWAIQALLLTVAIGALGLRTSERQQIYHDPVLVWQEATLRAPHSFRAHYNLGQALANRALSGDGARYRYLLLNDAAALGKQPDRLEKLPINEDVQAAIAAFETALKLEPTERSTHFNLAGLYDRTGQKELAMVEYQRELQNYPPHLHARLNLANIWQDQGNYEAAETILRDAIGFHPRDARPHLAQGKLLAAQQKHEEAESQLREALAKQPDMLAARYQLALSLWELGRQAEAIDALRALRRAHDKLGDVNLSLARFLILTDDAARKNPAAGTALAQQVLRDLGEEQPDAWEVHALGLAAVQRYDDAVAKLDRALQLLERAGDHARISELQRLRAQWQSHVSTTPEQR